MLKLLLTLNIAELPDGRWLIREYDRSYSSPGRALRAIRTGEPSMSARPIQWHPITSQGAEKVRALLAKEQKK